MKLFLSIEKRKNCIDSLDNDVDRQIMYICADGKIQPEIAGDCALRGGNAMNAFDNSEFDKHKAEAKEKWGNTQAYQQHQEKTKDYAKEKWDTCLHT